MIIFDAFAWLLIAKLAVLLFDDAVSTARGKRSPRLKARDKQRAASSTSASGSASTSAWRRSQTAVGGYLAGLVEDATVSARSSRRKRTARKHGRRAVDGVFTDLADDSGWYADCDTCGWSSRPYRIESNAQLAGAEHARTHRDDADDEAGEQSKPEAPTSPTGDASGGRPWKPTLIPGGKTATDQAGDGRDTDSEPAAEEPASTAPITSTDTQEDTVNTEATGPEEIRSAFATAIESANERAEETSGISALLTEVADRYESLEMAASTVGHIRDAADQFNAAEAALTSAAEELEAALADFNSRDGAVAETVADAGNLASKEVLVG